MFVRSLKSVEESGLCIEWGNGTSHRLLTKRDKMGFTVCHTVVRAGTQSELQYRNHLEACYCIDGDGEIEDMEGNVYPIQKGDMYVLDNYDRHLLRGGEACNLVLVSVFNPPLNGGECHDLKNKNGSAY